MTEYSAQALLSFLDYLAEKGLVKKATIVARKAAVNNVLAILDEEERSDLRKLDVDAVAHRFSTLRGSKYSPQSLKEYRVRLRNSLSDFLRYKENPANFKTSVPARALPSKRGTKPATSLSPDVLVPHRTHQTSPPTDSTFNVPVPIRPGVIVQINGIPTDLTKLEAAKIANVISAMASSGDG